MIINFIILIFFNWDNIVYDNKFKILKFNRIIVIIEDIVIYWLSINFYLVILW